MASISARAVARLVRAAYILGSLAGAIAYAASGVPGSVNVPNAAPAAKTGNALTGSGKAVAKPAPSAAAEPQWAELTPVQQQALSPLAAEWDKLSASHKKKWLAISSKFQSMKPEQQLRLQNRMRDWAKLTPEQRRVARESYSRAKKLNPGEKTAEWQQYQQLPEEQKKKLAADAAAKKRVANLPPASQAKAKVTPPPKSALKSGSRVEQPATPPAANQSATQQPSAQPAVK